MQSSFMPPSIESLADIDTADDSYEDASVVIQGVVSPSSSGGWFGENDDYEVHCFSFTAWRRLGEGIVKRELTVLRPVPPDAEYGDDFPEYSICRIRVLLSADATRAVFEKALPLDSPDEELQTLANELQRPVIVSTRGFGDLILDRGLGQFDGDSDWNGDPISVTFPACNDTLADDVLKVAESLWSEQSKWKKQTEDFAVREYLELKNGVWLDERESKLSAKDFIDRMTLELISISSDGEFEFWYDDGDLFWGHSIVVSGNLKDGPNRAVISG